jgi:hypothetical protein
MRKLGYPVFEMFLGAILLAAFALAVLKTLVSR